MNFDNVIDAAAIFVRRKIDKRMDIKNNLANDRAFRSYCECIGQLAIKMVKETEYFYDNIMDDMFCYESEDFVDVTMNEPVTVAARKLADEIIKDCRSGGIKINIGFIMFCRLVGGKPKTVSLTLRAGSRTA